MNLICKTFCCIIGITQLINKEHQPCFNESDVILFKSFSVYYELALKYAAESAKAQREVLPSFSFISLG